MRPRYIHQLRHTHRSAHRRTLGIIVALLLIGAWSSSTAQQGGEWVKQDATGVTHARAVDCAGADCLTIGEEGPEPHTQGNTRRIICRSTDGGRTWRVVYARDTLSLNPFRYALPYYCVAHPTPELCIVGADSGTIIRSSDGGETWERLRVWGRGVIGRLSMLDDKRGIAVVGNPTGLLRTVDGGKTWNPIPIPDNDTVRVGFTSLAYLESGTILTTTRVFHTPERNDTPTTVFWRTTNHGETWTAHPHDNILGAWELFFLDSLRGWIMGLSFDDRTGYYYDHFARTTDGGKTWRLVSDSTVGYHFGLHSFAFLDERNGVAVGPGKLIRTTDGGETWHQEGIGFPTSNPPNYTAVSLQPEGQFVMTWEGDVFRYEEKAGAADPSPIAEETITPRLYPNPSTAERLPRVHLDLVRPARVTVDVVNLRGEIITSLDTGTLDAGTHELEIASAIPAALPPGTYIARLTIGGCLHAVQFVVVQ